MSLLWSRLNKRWFVAAIAVGMAVGLGQIIVNCYTGMANIDSPYTRWLSINTDSSATTIFFILLPFLASIPAGNMLKEDLDSGLFNKFKLQVPVARLIMQYAAMAFMTGFVTIMIPLLLNLLGYLLILPNFKPDNLLNINIGVFNFNTMLVSLYYSASFRLGWFVFGICLGQLGLDQKSFCIIEYSPGFRADLNGIGYCFAN